ncbi:MAG: hypothetical protein J4N89_05960, partial [Chloroflexi bacterium]|nr:hypothetical protein [Chloroflexota bacterium]
VGDNVEEVFGSYKRLVKLDTFRYEHPNRARKSAGDDQAVSRKTEGAAQRDSIDLEAISGQAISGPADANPR